MGVLLHKQSGNEHNVILDFFVWNLAQDNPKKVFKVDFRGSSRFTTRKSAILRENLKNLLNFDIFGGKRDKSVTLAGIIFFTDFSPHLPLVLKIR